jgi:hypothetical protein
MRARLASLVLVYIIFTRKASHAMDANDSAEIKSYQKRFWSYFAVAEQQLSEFALTDRTKAGFWDLRHPSSDEPSLDADGLLRKLDIVVRSLSGLRMNCCHSSSSLIIFQEEVMRDGPTETGPRAVPHAISDTTPPFFLM